MASNGATENSLSSSRTPVSLPRPGLLVRAKSAVFHVAASRHFTSGTVEKKKPQQRPQSASLHTGSQTSLQPISHPQPQLIKPQVQSQLKPSHLALQDPFPLSQHQPSPSARPSLRDPQHGASGNNHPPRACLSVPPGKAFHTAFTPRLHGAHRSWSAGARPNHCTANHRLGGGGGGTSGNGRCQSGLTEKCSFKNTQSNCNSAHSEVTTPINTWLKIDSLRVCLPGGGGLLGKRTFPAQPSAATPTVVTSVLTVNSYPTCPSPHKPPTSSLPGTAPIAESAMPTNQSSPWGSGKLQACPKAPASTTTPTKATAAAKVPSNRQGMSLQDLAQSKDSAKAFSNSSQQKQKIAASPSVDKVRANGDWNYKEAAGVPFTVPCSVSIQQDGIPTQQQRSGIQTQGVEQRGRRLADPRLVERSRGSERLTAGCSSTSHSTISNAPPPTASEGQDREQEVQLTESVRRLTSDLSFHPKNDTRINRTLSGCSQASASGSELSGSGSVSKGQGGLQAAKMTVSSSVSVSFSSRGAPEAKLPSSSPVAPTLCLTPSDHQGASLGEEAMEMGEASSHDNTTTGSSQSNTTAISITTTITRENSQTAAVTGHTTERENDQSAVSESQTGTKCQSATARTASQSASPTKSNQAARSQSTTTNSQPTEAEINIQTTVSQSMSNSLSTSAINSQATVSQSATTNSHTATTSAINSHSATRRSSHPAARASVVVCPHPGTVPDVPSAVCLHPGTVPAVPSAVCLHPGTVPAVSSAVCLHPGTVPAVPSAVCLHPGSVPAVSSAVCLHPGSVPAVSSAVCLHPGTVPDVSSASAGATQKRPRGTETNARQDMASAPVTASVGSVTNQISAIQLTKQGPSAFSSSSSPSKECGLLETELSGQECVAMQLDGEEEEFRDELENDCSDDDGSDCSSISDASSIASFTGFTGIKEPMASEVVDDREEKPALVSSMFPLFPPTLYFSTANEKVELLPVEQRRLLKWKMSTVTPNVVKHAVTRSHFKVTKRSHDWLGCWGHHMKSPGFKNISHYQKLNHFPGSFQIGRKDRLWRNLSKMQARFGKPEFSFFPRSFILPQDIKLLRKAWEDSGSKQKWIIKPPASARGIGIQVIHKWSQMPRKRPLLVQKYLHKPYLISGNKFDLRIYVYVTSYDPLRVYIFSDGLVRFASCKYSSSMKSLSNKFMHLTNYSINKKNNKYQSNSDDKACQGHKWALKALWQHLDSKGINTTLIWEKIKDIVIKTIIASDPYVNTLMKMNVRSAYSCHELFGFDILLDENLKPWVLEVNISPSLHSNTALDVAIKGQMIRDVLNLAGFLLPQREEVVAGSCSSASSSTNSLCGGIRDKTRADVSTDEKVKRAFYLTQRFADQDFSSTVLDVLTPEDVRVLAESEDELSRKGQFERVFPSPASSRYLRFFECPRYLNLLLDQWEQRYWQNRSKGISLLRSLCQRGVHHGTTDPAHIWSKCSYVSRFEPHRQDHHSRSSVVVSQRRQAHADGDDSDDGSDPEIQSVASSMPDVSLPVSSTPTDSPCPTPNPSPTISPTISPSLCPTTSPTISPSLCPTPNPSLSQSLPPGDF